MAWNDKNFGSLDNTMEIVRELEPQSKDDRYGETIQCHWLYQWHCMVKVL